ncbi:MAG TPA: tripartite tricarboxylate transporter substrate binding protein [Burkholderiales bacterium]
MGQKQSERRDFLRAAGAVALGAGPLAAWAQAAPTGKVIKLIVGFPPGQATDTVTRLLADKMQAATGNTYVVDNRPGQGGSLALGVLAKSPPDGSTMMMVHMSAMATNPHLYKNVPYDAVKDFEAVGLVGDLPFVMVCNPSLPVQNVAELVAYAKAHPNKLTNSSSGNGTVSHLAMEEFKRQAGVAITHVPYKGSAQGITDVIAGTVSMALETAPAVQPFVQSGKLRALAAGTTKRLAWIPNVPTLAELGYNGINAVTWLMLIYPAGTPKAMVNSHFEAINKIVAMPEIEQRFASLGVLPRSSKSPDEADAYIRSEFVAWGAVVKRSGTVLE